MRKIKLFSMISAASMCLFGCTNDSVIDDTRGNTDIYGKSDNPFVSIELSSSEDKITEGLWNFTMDLLKEAHSENPNENFCFSPLSLAMVTGMVANGLDEEAQKELLSSLHFEEGMEALNGCMNTLLTKLPGMDKRSELNTANLMWLRSDKVLSPSYSDVLSSKYNASLMSESQWGISQISAINKWGSDNSGGAIDRIYTDQDASLNLDRLWLNIMHFDGVWSERFEKAFNRDMTFTCGDGSQETVEMMTKWTVKAALTDECLFQFAGVRIPLFNDDELLQVTMTFGNSSYCFTAILPPVDNKDVDYVFSNFAYDSEVVDETRRIVGALYDDATSLDLNIRIPKINFENEVNLIPILQGMGVRNLFENVSFPGISGSEEISKMDIFRQKIDFKTNEDGAKFEVVTEDGAAGSSYPETVTFNRPFGDLVWERSTRAVLLAGVYMHP